MKKITQRILIFVLAVAISLIENPLFATMHVKAAYSTGNLDTCVKLLNSSGGQIDSDDDDGYGKDFMVSDEIPSRTGYEFAGWSTSSYDTSVEYYPEDTEDYYLVTDRTLYSVWESANVLQVNSTNYASVDSYAQSVWYNFTPVTSGRYVIYSTSNVYDTCVTLYESGSEIEYNDQGGEDDNFRLESYLEAGKTYSYEVRFYSDYQTGTIPFSFEKVYTIQYDANGGEYPPASQSKYSGKSVALSYLIPSKEGCTFLGWATSSTATKPDYQQGGIYSADTDVTLYAVWQKAVSSIVISSNPKKTKYSIGESLDVAGLTLSVLYVDGTTETVTEGFNASGFSSATKGSKLVTITYGGVATTFTVNVYDVVSDDYECKFLSDGTIEIEKYTGNSSIVSVPAQINGYMVTSIGAHAFEKNNTIQSIILTDTLLTTIGAHAFDSCELLSNVGLPASIKTIREYAFHNCQSLVLVAIPESASTIGEYAFGYNSSYQAVFGFTLIGYSGTVAYKYAQNYKITFNNLGDSSSGKKKAKKSIKFTKKSVKIKRGKKVTLKVKITGAKKAKFSVDKKGKKVVKLMKKKAKSVVVKGKKKGKAVITAKAAGKKAKCKVTVK